MDFEQPVPAFLVLLLQQDSFVADFGRKVSIIQICQNKGLYARLELFKKWLRSRIWMTEAVEPLVEKCCPTLGRVALEYRNVDTNVVFLPNPIKAADTLLNQVTVEWQVEQDHLRGELEVSTFTANL